MHSPWKMWINLYACPCIPCIGMNIYASCRIIPICACKALVFIHKYPSMAALPTTPAACAVENLALLWTKRREMHIPCGCVSPSFLGFFPVLPNFHSTTTTTTTYINLTTDCSVFFRAFLSRPFFCVLLPIKKTTTKQMSTKRCLRARNFVLRQSMAIRPPST